MMKIQNAIKCDCCHQIKDADKEVFASIVPIEDMFEPSNSFPSDMNTNRSNIHYCYECYRESVLIPAQNMADRKKDEQGYLRILEELKTVFRKTVFIAGMRNPK